MKGNDLFKSIVMLLYFYVLYILFGIYKRHFQMSYTTILSYF